MSAKKKLTRSRTNRMLGGVCGGLGEYFNIDPTVIRLAFVALILFGMGSPLLGYILLWLIMPRAEDAVIKGELPVVMPESSTNVATDVADRVSEAGNSTEAVTA